ncbi:Calcium/calmodulin-dependent protein kinase type I, partial [Spiromyces aspiralis]
MTICKGGHSVVVELINVKSHSRFAAKVIKKEHTRHHDDVIRNEIQIMRRVSGRHQNVLSLRDFFETPNNVYLVSDLYSGGDLFDRVLESGRLPEPQVTRIMRSLVGAVAYLHSNGIVHHDIKPENIVFKTMDMDSPLALADFGLAENVDHNGRCWNVGGTPGYMAPEITANRYHGKPSDMWALGIVSYFALSGHTPFGLRARAGFLEHSFAIECYRFLQFDIWNTISWPAIKFICELLVVDPARRLTAGQASRHSWLTQAAESSGNSLATAISPVEEIYDDEYLEGDYASYFNP